VLDRPPGTVLLRAGNPTQTLLSQWRRIQEPMAKKGSPDSTNTNPAGAGVVTVVCRSKLDTEPPLVKVNVAASIKAKLPLVVPMFFTAFPLNPPGVLLK
jgi:hypothetical protein